MKLHVSACSGHHQVSIPIKSTHIPQPTPNFQTIATRPHTRDHSPRRPPQNRTTFQTSESFL